MSNSNHYKKFVRSNQLKSDHDVRRSYTYDLQVFEDDFRFTLSIPPTGELIEDDFDGLHKRKSLYQKLDGGEIYKWLCEVHESIQDDFLLKTFRMTMYKKF